MFEILPQSNFVTFHYNFPIKIMASIKLKINDKNYTVDVDRKMPLLWAIRDIVGLTGTNNGCGIAQCGACTVHLEGNPVRSCQYPRRQPIIRILPQSKGFPPITHIRFNRHGFSSRYLSAVIASQVKLWLQRPC